MGDRNQLANNNSTAPISIINRSVSACQIEVSCSSEGNENENNQHKKEVIVNPCGLAGKTTFINCNPDIIPQFTQSMFFRLVILI